MRFKFRLGEETIDANTFCVSLSTLVYSKCTALRRVRCLIAVAIPESVSRSHHPNFSTFKFVKVVAITFKVESEITLPEISRYRRLVASAGCGQRTLDEKLSLHSAVDVQVRQN